MESDQVLLGKYIATQDALAFAELTRRYQGLVFGTAKRVTGSHHDAEDVAQWCFVLLASKACEIRSSVAGWLHARAVARSLNMLQSGKRRKFHEEQAAAREELADDEGIAWNEIVRRVDRAIEELPEELRVPLIFYYLQGLTQEQIAENMGLSQRTVSRRLGIGIERLRRGLKRGDVLLSAGAFGPALKHLRQPVVVPPTLRLAGPKIGLYGIRPKPLPLTTKARYWAETHRVAVVVAALAIPVAAAIMGANWIGGGAPARQDPYSLIRDALGGSLESRDPLALDNRIAALAASPELFWAGGKDHFYRWLKARPEKAAIAGAPALRSTAGFSSKRRQEYWSDEGGISREATALDLSEGGWSTPGIDLLEAMVTLRLEWKPADSSSPGAADASLLSSYNAALSRRDEEPLRAGGRAANYDDALRLWANGDKINRGIIRMGGGPAAVIRDGKVPPVDAIVAALAGAAEQSGRFQRTLHCGSVAELSGRIADVAEIRFCGDGPERGNRGYLVLLRQAFGSGDRKALLLLEQVLPAASERQGFWPGDGRLAARRYAEDARLLLSPAPALANWGELGGWSFRVELFGPTGSGAEEPRDVRVAARDLGRLLAQQHLRAAKGQRITTGDGALASRLADEYVATLRDDFGDFTSDGRVKAHVRRYESALAAMTK